MAADNHVARRRAAWLRGTAAPFARATRPFLFALRRRRSAVAVAGAAFDQAPHELGDVEPFLLGSFFQSTEQRGRQTHVDLLADAGGRRSSSASVAGSAAEVRASN